MKNWFIDNYLQPIIAGSFTLVFLIIIVFVTALAPSQVTDTTKLFFEIILAACTFWLGIAINTEKAKKQGVANWIPIAESSCKKLLAMQVNIDQMRSRQGQVCQKLKIIFPEISAKQLAPIQSVLEMRCELCQDNLLFLKSQVVNNYGDWDAFIKMNCEKDVCEAIHDRIDVTKKEYLAPLKPC